MTDLILCPCHCGRLIYRHEYERWTGRPAPEPTGKKHPSYKTKPVKP